jgi:membrane protease YdiL (CAAX protease family)
VRIPVGLAWLLLGLGFFTAALLRQFHDRTPESPLTASGVGNLLFAAIFFLLLVSAWEWRRGPVAGRGVRLGSLTPLLLILFVEKWVSISIYPLFFDRYASPTATPALLDAQYRGLAGVGLLAVCLLVGRFSRPASRKSWRRARPSRWPLAALAALGAIGTSYLLLAVLSGALGADFRMAWPRATPLLGWIIGGQALLAFAEELYYRGLLMSEVERLAPRLGVKAATGRRWLALGFTSALFGAEHLTLGPPWGASLRQMVFIIALGLLFGILVMLSANLHFSAAIHAWINCLLLGAAPYLVHEGGRPALPPGTYIGLALILAFVLTFAIQRWRMRRDLGEPGELMQA